MRQTLVLATLAMTVLASSARTQSLANAPAHVPFGVGEHLEYDFRAKDLGIEVHVGTGTMDVLAIDTLRGHEVWHTVFRVSGGLPLLRVNDLYESWIDTHTLSSFRYHQDIHDPSYQAQRDYEIFPDRREYTDNGGPPQKSVAHPLDDGSFVYFVRTIPLTVGHDTVFEDYFRADRNPVEIHIVRKEQIKIAPGTCNAIVVQPTIHTTGLFSQNGHAEVWFSDDSDHVMLQMKANLPVPGGHLNLYLKSYRLAGDSTRRIPACDPKRPGH